MSALEGDALPEPVPTADATALPPDARPLAEVALLAAHPAIDAAIASKEK
jgi:hypothetical protein